VFELVVRPTVNAALAFVGQHRAFAFFASGELPPSGRALPAHNVAWPAFLKRNLRNAVDGLAVVLTLTAIELTANYALPESDANIRRLRGDTAQARALVEMTNLIRTAGIFTHAAIFANLLTSLATKIHRTFTPLTPARQKDLTTYLYVAYLFATSALVLGSDTLEQYVPKHIGLLMAHGASELLSPAWMSSLVASTGLGGAFNSSAAVVSTVARGLLSPDIGYAFLTNIPWVLRDIPDMAVGYIHQRINATYIKGLNVTHDEIVATDPPSGGLLRLEYFVLLALAIKLLRQMDTETTPPVPGAPLVQEPEGKGKGKAKEVVPAAPMPMPQIKPKPTLFGLLEDRRSTRIALGTLAGGLVVAFTGGGRDVVMRGINNPDPVISDSFTDLTSLAVGMGLLLPLFFFMIAMVGSFARRA